jgi:hypothetical protein
MINANFFDIGMLHFTKCFCKLEIPKSGYQRQDVEGRAKNVGSPLAGVANLLAWAGSKMSLWMVNRIIPRENCGFFFCNQL